MHFHANALQTAPEREGKNYVREIYLKTAVKEQNSDKDSKGLVERRQRRVWPKY